MKAWNEINKLKSLIEESNGDEEAIISIIMDSSDRFNGVDIDAIKILKNSIAAFDGQYAILKSLKEMITKDVNDLKYLTKVFSKVRINHEDAYNNLIKFFREFDYLYGELGSLIWEIDIKLMNHNE